MLKIEKQMLKYLKSIIQLVKNLRGGYLTYHPLQSKIWGVTSPLSPGFTHMFKATQRKIIEPFLRK